jgi:hypothetical protein
MPLGIPDTRAFPWDESLKSHLGQLNNGATGGINTWAVNPTVGIDGLALGANHIGYTGLNTSTNNLLHWDGTTWKTVLKSAKTITTDFLDVYVSKNTGNDSNDGKSSSTAWQTITKLYQELNAYGSIQKQVNLYLGAGRYALRLPPAMKGGRIHVYGQSSASTLLQDTNLIDVMMLLQGVTIGFPELNDTTVVYYPFFVHKCRIALGPDVVLGAIGTNNIGQRFNMFLVESTVFIYGGIPITVTGGCSTLFYLDRSTLMTLRASNNPAQVQLNKAPTVDLGEKITGFSPLTDPCVINYVGVMSNTIFTLVNGAMSHEAQGMLLKINGATGGKAYSMTDASVMYAGTVVGEPTIGFIGFPNTVSAGSKDVTSTIHGTVGI